MGDTVDDSQEAHDRTSAASTPADTSEAGTETTEAGGAGATANSDTTERIRVYLRDHAHAGSGEIGKALGIDSSTVRRHIRDEKLRREGENLSEPKGKKPAAPKGKGSSTDPIDVHARAEVLAAGTVAGHLGSEIAKQTNATIDEAIGNGMWLRDWFVGKGLHTQFADSNVWLQMITTFWWENKGMVGELRQRIDELEEDLAAAHAALDPELEYRQASEDLERRAVMLALLGRKLDPAYYDAKVRELAEHREAPHLPAEWVTSLITEAVENNDGRT